MINRYTRPEMAKIWSKENKFALMLEIELLALEAQSKILKAVPEDVLPKVRGLARFDVKNIEEIEKRTNHDIVAFITDVTSHLGEYAQYFHKGLTSNDLLDTSFALQVKQATEIICSQIDRLLPVVKDKALKYKDVLCMGRTHGVHAEPITTGLKFALFYDELTRSKARIERAAGELAVGKLSGAVGNFVHNPPEIEEYVCGALGINPAPITTQVVPRDRHGEYISALALLGGCLERFAIEIRHLQRTEVLEWEEPFKKGQKGSSAMPHKRNPILCERITGIARMLRGNVVPAMENIALWHERDISHSSVERVIFPDTTILVDYALEKMIFIVKDMAVYKDNIMSNINKSFNLIYSQSLLGLIMDKGVERMKAYDMVQRNAMQAWKEKTDFKALVLKDRGITEIVSEDEIESVFSPDRFVKNIDAIYKRVGLL